MAQLPIRQRWTPPAARLEGERLLKARRAQQRVADAAYQTQADAKAVEAQAEQVLSEKVDDLEKTVDKLIENIPRILPASGGGRRTLKKLLDRYYELPGGLGSAAGAAIEDFATAAQGDKAVTAVQPDDLGTAAAADTTDFATAAQGTTADSAVQPGDLADVATSGSAADVSEDTSGTGALILRNAEREKINAINVFRAATIAAAATINLSGWDQAIVNRYDSSTEFAPAYYLNVGASEPTHDAKFQDSVGTWFEMAPGQQYGPAMFGCRATSTVDDVGAFQRALDFLEAIGGGTIDGGGLSYVINSTGLKVNGNHVFVNNARLAVNKVLGAPGGGFRITWAADNDTEGGGYSNLICDGDPVIAGLGGIRMGTNTTYAHRWKSYGGGSDSMGQYGLGIESGSGWQCLFAKVTNHGTTSVSLTYGTQTANFTPGSVVTGGTSGATGTILTDNDAGTTGTLNMNGVTGTFVLGEVITDAGGGSATITFVGIVGIGIYVKPGMASSGGQLLGYSSELSAAAQANLYYTSAAVKLESHSDLYAGAGIAIGGIEECMSVSCISGKVKGVTIKPTSGRSGLTPLNHDPASAFSGQTFTIEDVDIIGSTGFGVSFSGLPPKTVSSVDTGTDKLTIAAHGWLLNTPISIVSSGAVPGGLVADVVYYLINVGTNDFQLSATRGGAALDLTSAGSGTIQVQPVRLSNCTLRNIRTSTIRMFANFVYKNCVFEGIEANSILLDATAAGVTAPVIGNTGNVHRGVITRPLASTDRHVFNAPNSVFENCGQILQPGVSCPAVPQWKGTGVKVINPIGPYLTQYADPASAVDGSGANVAVAITSTSGLSLGDPIMVSANNTVSGAMLTAHINTSSAIAIRLQNESGSTVDMPNTRFAVKRILHREMKRFSTKAAHQFDTVNVADGGRNTTTLTVPGVALGDCCLASWKSTVGNMQLFSYVSAADTVTVVLQNETGSSSSANTATADLNVAVLRDDAADYSNAAVYDPASLADAAGVTTTLTIPGASVGDFVAVSFSLDLAGVLLTAEVSTADTVSVRFQNESGGTIDLASGTIKALVFKS